MEERVMVPVWMLGIFIGIITFIVGWLWRLQGESNFLRRTQAASDERDQRIFGDIEDLKDKFDDTKKGFDERFNRFDDKFERFEAKVFAMIDRATKK